MDVHTFRERLNVTQRRAADLLGVSVPTIKRWEQGRIVPTLTAIRLMDRIIAERIKPIPAVHTTKTGIIPIPPPAAS